MITKRAELFAGCVDDLRQCSEALVRVAQQIGDVANDLETGSTEALKHQAIGIGAESWRACAAALTMRAVGERLAVVARFEEGTEETDDG